MTDCNSTKYDMKTEKASLENFKFKLNLSSTEKQQFDKFNCNVKFKDSDTPELPKNEYGYDPCLNVYRNNIDNINNEIWKKVRWYINEYDFVVKYPIINRAFYKYWEMINEFEIFNLYNHNSDIILHCAEAPGGFIQGTNIFLQIEKNNIEIDKNKNIPEVDDDGFTKYVSKKKNSKKTQYKIYTISLNKDLPKYKIFNLPSYNKIIMNKYVHMLYGKDESGDINNVENIDYIQSIVLPKQFYLITGDGGFDEGCDFNNKEQLHYQLILNEIYSAIKLQKTDGHFILKMFDIFTDSSLHLLYLLTLCYSEVYIYKPVTSRPTNSEKYIICKNFCLNDENKDFLIHELKTISKLYNEKVNSQSTNYCSFTLFNVIPQEFIDNIKYINTQLLNRQCSFLQKAIVLCNDSNFITNYNNEYTKSFEHRKDIFKKFITYYNLHYYF